MKSVAYCEERIRAYIKNICHMPDDIPNVFSEDGDRRGIMKPREMNIAVLFADIRAATVLSERIPADQLFRLLNVWFVAMGAVIASHNGTIIDYVGDSIIVTFGDPDGEADGIAQRDSVSCAIAMQKEMEAVNALYAEIEYPPVEMGIGIHYGTVYAGSIGTSARLKYDIIGRDVNLASRIQAQSKGGEILISDDVKQALGDDIQTASSHEIIAKGIAEPVLIHEVVIGS